MKNKSCKFSLLLQKCLIMPGILFLFLFCFNLKGEENLEKVKSAAKAGKPEAQLNLGNRYFNGNGVRKDASEAVKWYRKAAEQGNAKAKKILKEIEASLPKDLLKVSDAVYSSTSGLASGSSEAQQKQKATVEKTGLPLEVKTNKTDIHFRLVPAGTFMMGSELKYEKQHRVTLSKAYYVGKYEVTQAQWKKVMGSNPSDFTSSGENAPVERVSWNDCQKFLKKLNKLEGVPQGTYRLLTEAEWEYACRAGTDTAFCYGDSLNSRQADFENLDEKTVSVGSFKPNAFGLYDMHGNVWEWCSDWFGLYPTGSVTDPTGASSGSSGRVFRGSCWCGSAGGCRSANRAGGSPDRRINRLGFRLARNISVRK